MGIWVCYQQKKKMKQIKYLSIISGKGGAGKTIIALSLSKVLAELELKVLLIDCDLSTHGASYFYENEFETNRKKALSVQSILNNLEIKNEPITISDKFSFIPSTLDATNTRYENPENFHYYFNRVKENYDIIIFDCQAGYSTISKSIVELSDKNLLVLEADSVSSSALRVLYLQIGNVMTNKNTWQIFNKLSEEERIVYNKIIGGTLFPNLPPIPFDWKVRAAFSLGQIPSIDSKDSAYGLAILRLAKQIFNQHEELINSFEEKTVGNWFEEIMLNLNELEKRKESVNVEFAERKRNAFKKRVLLISTVIMAFSIFLIMLGLPQFKKELPINLNFEIIVGITGVLTATLLGFYSSIQSKEEKIQDENQRAILSLENEIEKYRTLIETDPRLKEFYKENSKINTTYNKA